MSVGVRGYYFAYSVSEAAGAESIHLAYSTVPYSLGSDSQEHVRVCGGYSSKLRGVRGDGGAYVPSCHVDETPKTRLTASTRHPPCFLPPPASAPCYTVCNPPGNIDHDLTIFSTMSADLSALLNASKALTSHLSRPDLPSVNLSLDQIEAQSRRLVSRQPGTSADTSRA